MQKVSQPLLTALKTNARYITTIGPTTHYNPTLLAFQVTVVDLAGNTRIGRATALFAPPGLPNAAMKLTALARLSVLTATASTNTIQGVGIAPHVWQNTVDGFQVPTARAAHC